MNPIKIKAKLRAYTKASLLEVDKGIVVNEENLIGDGTKDHPLDLAFGPDGITIIRPHGSDKISAVCLLDNSHPASIEEELPQQDEPSNGRMVLPNPMKASDIRGKFEEVDSNLDRIDDTLSTIDDRFQLVEDSHNELFNKISNVGGYLPANNFNTFEPTQEDLTTYALGILGLTEENKKLIPNQIRVKNIYEDPSDPLNESKRDRLWILNNMTVNDHEIFEWVDEGSDTVGVATTRTLGLVKSSLDQYEGRVEPNGEIFINGLSDKIEDFETRISSNFDEINLVTADLGDLQHITFKDTNGKEISGVTTLTKAIANHDQRITSNFNEINNLTAEVSDFKEDYQTELNSINGNFTSVADKIREIDSSLQGTINDLNSATQTMWSNFDTINKTIGDIPSFEFAPASLKTADGIIVSYDIDNTTLETEATEIFKYVNNHNGGSLVSVNIKTGSDPAYGEVTEVIQSNEGNKFDTLSSQPLLAPNTFYCLYPEQIYIGKHPSDETKDICSIFFGCKMNYPAGKGTLQLTGIKNVETGLYENPTAKLSGEAFAVFEGTLYKYYFQNIDVSNVNLAHLTVKFTYYPG